MKPLILRISLAACPSILVLAALTLVTGHKPIESVIAQPLAARTEYGYDIGAISPLSFTASFTSYLPIVFRPLFLFGPCTIPIGEATQPGARLTHTFTETVPCLTTPDSVSQFMSNNIKWEGDYDNRTCGGNCYFPAWLVYQNGIDDCDGHAILQCFILEANGWDAYMIGLSIEGGGPGHNVCGVNTGGQILVLDNEGQFVGPFNTLANVACHYIAKGWMWNGGSLRTIRASQVNTITTDYTMPKVTDLPWAFHQYNCPN